MIETINQGENSSLLANVGLDIVQAGIDLNTKMNKFLQEHTKWKAEDFKRKREIDNKFATIRFIQPKNKRNTNERLRRVLTEQQAHCENNIREFTNHKHRIRMAQKQKKEMDISLEIYKKQLDAINGSKRIVSPLNEIQRLLENNNRVLKGIKEPNKELPPSKNDRINKILADLDKDMKELNELLY